MTEEVELRLTADMADASKEVAGFRKEYAAMVQAVEKPLRQTDALLKTQQTAKAAAADFYTAKQRVERLQDALSKVRGPSDALAKSLAAARTQADAAASAVERQKKKIDEQRQAVDKARTAYAALKASMAGGGTSAESVAGARLNLSEQVEQLRKLQGGLRAQREELAATGRSAKELAASYDQAVQPVRLIQKDLRGVEQALSKATAEFDRQKAKVREQRIELRAAGVDTRMLAAEQQRLQSELRKAVGAGRADIDRQRNAAAVQGIRARSAALTQQANAQRIANLEAARENLGINRFRTLQAEIQRTTQQYEQLRRGGKLSAQELAVAQQQLTERIRESRRELSELAGQGGIGDLVSDLSGGIGGRLGGAGGAAAGVAGAVLISAQYAAALDPIKNMTAQLRLATDGQEEFNKAQRDTFQIAQQNQAPLGDVVGLYARLAPALRDVGRGQDDALQIIDAVTKSLRISGASAQEAASAIQQFSQAMGSGVLRGEEFNTLAESSPRLLRALADGLNANVGALRAMAAEGKLTADVIANSLIGQLPKLTAEAEQLPDTLAGAMTRLRNELQGVLGDLDRMSGASERIVKLVNALSGAVGSVRTGSASEAVRDVGGLADALVDLHPLLGRLKSRADEVLGQLGVQASASAETVESGRKKYELQLQMLEMAEADSQVRRNVRLEKSASEREGIRFSEEESLRRHTAELGLVYEEYIAREEERRRVSEAGEKAHNEKMKSLRDQAIAEKQREIKAAEDQLKKANASLSKARESELAIEREFTKLISDVRGGGATGDASLSDAYDARVNARRALQAGDSQRAIEEARRAGEILKQLQSAGVNDYGFEGIAEDLARIAGEAAKLERVNTKQEVAAVSAQLENLKKEAEALAVVSVDVQWDGAGSEQILQKMKALAAELAKVMIIRPTVLPPVVGEADAEGYVRVPNLPPPPAFARGGILGGRGTGTSDSNLAWFSKGEGFINARAVKHYGEGLVHQINRLQLPKFATGGVLGGGLSLPPIPQLAPALQQQLDGPNFPDLGRMVLEMGGQSYTVYAPPDQANELKLAAMKFGRTSRR